MATAASIVWHVGVIVLVLAVTAYAPNWGTIPGAAVAFILSLAGPKDWRCALGFHKPRQTVATLIGGILLGAALFFFTKMFLQHLCEIVTQSKRDLSGFDFTRGRALENLPFLFLTIFGAGVSEEVIHRGAVISRLSAILPNRKLTSGLVVLVSAIIFGVAHPYQGPAGILVTGLIGILLGFLYVASGRMLWPGILVHATYDVIGYFAISTNFDRTLERWSLGIVG